jgi:hypothetical protein
MKAGLPLGKFTCPIRFEIVRPPKPVVKDEDGVTYVMQGDYEILFRTVLRLGKARSCRSEPNFTARTARRLSCAMRPVGPSR